MNNTELLDALSCCLIILDANNKVAYMNQAAEELVHQSATRAVGHSIFKLIRHENLQQHIAYAVQAGEKHTIRRGRLQLHNMTWITIDYCITVLSANKILLELNQVDRQLRRLKTEQLVNQQQATQAIMRGMAHEIKNPLGGIRGAAQLLELELANEELKEYTHIIVLEADRLKNLVNQMLGPNDLPQLKLTNIHAVLEQVRHLVSTDLPQNINIQLDYDPSIPEFLADYDQLVQVVLNIVNNAIKALGKKGHILFRTRIKRQMTIRHQHHRLVLHTEIIDDGSGVPKKIRDKLFYPMISGSAEGSGLGLSIAQSLITKHNGLIEYQSKVGKTRFSIFIPLENGNG